MWTHSAILDGALFNVLLLAFKEFKQPASKYLRRFFTWIPNHEENYSVLEDPDFEITGLETLPQENTRKKINSKKNLLFLANIQIIKYPLLINIKVFMLFD